LDEERVDIVDDTRGCVNDGEDMIGRAGNLNNEQLESTGVSGGDGGRGIERIRGSSGDKGRPCSSLGKIGRLRD
jgi:hypothetical protein